MGKVVRLKKRPSTGADEAEPAQEEDVDLETEEVEGQESAKIEVSDGDNVRIIVLSERSPAPTIGSWRGSDHGYTSFKEGEKLVVPKFVAESLADSKIVAILE